MPHCSHVLRQRRVLLVSAVLLGRVLLTVSAAQVPTAIRPDGTLGTTVTQSGNVYTILGGTRPGNGPNLFHSFDHFSVGTGDTASFSGPAGIQNILSRVTGGQQSMIDGQLQSTISGANLYLLNPNGVMFGPNATLDVRGSFHVSTADVLRFADGATFAAHLSEKTTLTVAPPAAFGFLSAQPAPITLQGSTLRVSEGQALSVVGGDMQIMGGKLVAPGGRIQVASVASSGDVMFSPVELAPELRVDAVMRLGRLELSQGALLDASGNGGGTVRIRSGRLMVDQAAIFADNQGKIDGMGLGVDLESTAEAVITNRALITTDSLGAGRARDLRLTAGNVSLDRSTIGSRPFSSGAGGNVTLHVGSLSLTGGASIDSGTRGSGRGGTVTVAATEAVALSGGSGLFSQAEPGSRGNAGTLEVQAGRLTLTGGSRMSSSTFGPGDAGQVVVSAPALTLDGGRIQTVAVAGSSGNGGSIDVRAGRLTLTGGASIDSGTRGSGRGGTVTVAATEAVVLSGQDSAVLSDTQGSGAAGTVQVTAPQLIMQPGTVISSSTAARTATGAAGMVMVRAGVLDLQGGVISSESNLGSTGDAGMVVVEGTRLTVGAGGQISGSTFGAGRGGTVTVTATERLTLAGQSPLDIPSGVFSDTSGSGAAGTVQVTAPQLTMQTGAVIRSATFATGAAGMVMMRAGVLDMQGGRVSVETQGTGQGGELSVEVGQLTLADGAQILSTTSPSSATSGPGAGGTVMVTAHELIRIAGQNSAGTLISGLFSFAGEQGGAAGRLIVTAPTLVLEDGGQINTSTLGAGRAGDIRIEVGQLTLRGGAQIESSTFGTGAGGTVMVTAHERIHIAGRDSTGSSSSGLFSLAGEQGVAAGRLIVTAPTLVLEDRGQIDASTLGAGQAGDIRVEVGQLTLTGGAQLGSRTFGPGAGGTVTVTATDAVVISGQNSRLTTSTVGAGQGGAVTLQARRVDLTDGATIAAASTGAGNAGNITITSQDSFLSTHGSVVTRATQADGGNIQITAPHFLRLRDSAITAEVGGGAMTVGGNITVDPQFVVLQNSQISANAFEGKGGNIHIQAQQVFLADPASTVSASSEKGINGQVNIQTPVTNISGSLVLLPQAFARPATLLSTRCAERLREGTISSLVVRGRDGVPARPGEVLPLPLALAPPEAAEAGGTAGPPEDTAASRVGGLHLDDRGQAQVRGWPGQGVVPAVLALECAK